MRTVHGKIRKSINIVDFKNPIISNQCEEDGDGGPTSDIEMQLLFILKFEE